ncbi:hypothetical protein BH11CYA1_BH11CYA1_32690 [soil metagenome]
MSTSNTINPMPRRLAITACLSLFIAISVGIGWLARGLDGLTIAAIFALMVVILITVTVRTRDRKITIKLDERAQAFVQESACEHMGVLRLLAQKFGSRDYEKLQQDARRKHSIQKEEGNFIFVEVEPKDGQSTDCLLVTGHEVENHRVLRCQSHAVADAIAALLLHLRDDKQVNKVPHIYMSWSEIHPLAYALRYAIFGEGETAPLIREKLRSQEHEPANRPIVHVA